VEGYTRRAQWCSLDFARRSAVARLAQTLSSVPDLSPAFSTLAAERSLDRDLRLLLQDLMERGKLDMEEGPIDLGSRSLCRMGASL